MYRIIDLYKALPSGATLLPTSTNFTFWDSTYGTAPAVIDREFARRFAGFSYYDFMNADTEAEAITNLKADVLSILTFNQKRYTEMYRIFLATDAQMPFDYNYDMTETTGKQHTETQYGATSATKGSQENTEGAVTNTHSVAPFNTATASVADSADAKTSQTFTEGQRTDTTLAHTDEYDSDEWTLSRKGNIGVQTAGDIARIFTQYWTEYYKFMQLIFDDICKQLLIIED